MILNESLILEPFDPLNFQKLKVQRVFFILDIVYGVKGDTNCCPPAFILERYKYNSDIRQMDLLDKKEYPTKEISNDNGTTNTNSVELLDFINKNKAASFVY
ncbi:MAG: hypothetical protein PHT44_00040 [Candidatus Portnoybacteria bacterium]|nr:hypothetical protein [Candidatus Portnoybacteria bacterium]